MTVNTGFLQSDRHSGTSFLNEGGGGNLYASEILSEFMNSGERKPVSQNSAYLCQDCGAVGNSALRCPSCASEVLMGLGRAI
jgi:hypothetical protein